MTMGRNRGGDMFPGIKGVFTNNVTMASNTMPGGIVVMVVPVLFRLL